MLPKLTALKYMYKKAVELIDNFLNNITMYRLLLYYLIVLLLAAAVFGLFGLLPYNAVSIVFSTCFLVAICWTSNFLLASIYKVQTNIESAYITALILALILSPARSLNDVFLLGWTAILAMASKYIVTIKKKHIFNPAAIAVVITAFILKESATWWVGNLPLMAFVLLGGILIVRKIRRTDLVLTFFVYSLAAILGNSLFRGTNVLTSLKIIIFYSPWAFFAFVMLTEPLTTPPTKKLQIIYAALVGILFAPQIHIGSLYTTPEIALVIGNLFSYLVSPKYKLNLKLKERFKIAANIYDFVFSLDRKISFTPGQYMEWTLGHKHPDRKGNRRYFTIASSPTEENIRIGVKIPENVSSFKNTLLSLPAGSEIAAASLAGDFVLKKAADKKYVFIAGGIGITPYRSIIKYLLDTNQKKDIILFYSNKSKSEIVYKDIFDQAEKNLDIKTVYNLTDKENIPSSWQGKIGRIDEQMIKEEVPDYTERIFYLSGPHGLVTAFEDTLAKMGIKKIQIKTDYFPGYN